MFERTVKWARRKPAWAAVASLAAALIIGLGIGTILFASLANERDVQRKLAVEGEAEANRQKKLAVEGKAEADRQKKLAVEGEAKAVRYLQFAETRQADLYWHQGQANWVLKKLSRDPADGGAYDFAREHLRSTSAALWGRWIGAALRFL